MSSIHLLNPKLATRETEDLRFNMKYYTTFDGFSFIRKNLWHEDILDKKGQ